MRVDEFLLARVAEDEVVARERPAGALIHVSGCYYYNHSLDAGWFCDCAEEVDQPSRRLLAECAAKRLIVEYRYSWNLQAERMSDPPFGPILKTQVSTADAILRALARPYADHADYDPEWGAPDALA